MIEFKDKGDAKINSTYNPKEEIQKIRKHIYERYYKMKAAKQHPWGGNMEDKFITWQKQYESFRPSKDEMNEWQSTIVPPFTTSIVEKELAEIIGQTLRPVAVERGEEDKIPAKIVNRAVDYTWEIGYGDLEAYDAIKQALILGKTVWQEYYYQDKREVMALKKFNMETGEEEYEKKIIYDFDDCYGETVPLVDFFIDPSADHINRGSRKAQDCIRRYLMDYNSFMENFKGSIWDNLGATKFVKAGASGDYYQYFTPHQNHEDLVEVLFYWGRRPDKLIIVANDVVIRNGPNPYAHKQLPFAEGSDVKRIKGSGFWDLGEPELLNSIQDELTTIRRMRLDRQHMDIFKMFFVSDRDAIDEDENFVAPNRYIPVNDPNSVKALEYRDINPSAYREEELLKDDGRKVTGMETPASSSTATEAAIFREVTMKSLQMKIWLLSTELFADIAKLRTMNIIQFWTTPKTLKVVDNKLITEYRKIRTSGVALEVSKTGDLVERKSEGENFFIVTPELITPQYGGFDFKFTAKPSLPVAKTLQQTKFVELTNSPVFQASIANQYYDVNKVSDAMVAMHDFDPTDFINTASMDIPEQVVDEEKILELAKADFEQILKGVAVPPTPYVPKSHTEIHLAQMSSDVFKQKAKEDPQILQNMVTHILGEASAQEQRGEEGVEMPEMEGMTGQFANTESTGILQGTAKASMPNKILGPENTPQAMTLSRKGP